MMFEYNETTQAEIRIPLASLWIALQNFIGETDLDRSKELPEKLKDVDIRAIKGSASVEPQYIRIRYEKGQQTDDI